MRAGSYLDTSFLWKVYVTEPDSSLAVGWLNQYPETTFVSELSDVEMSSSLHRQLSPQEAAKAEVVYQRNVRSKVYERLSVHSDVLRLAATLARQYGGSIGLRSLDAIQLAICVHYGVSEIATFDARLARAAQASGIKLSL